MSIARLGSGLASIALVATGTIAFAQDLKKDASKEFLFPRTDLTKGLVFPKADTSKGLAAPKGDSGAELLFRPLAIGSALKPGAEAKCLYLGGNSFRCTAFGPSLSPAFKPVEALPAPAPPSPSPQPPPVKNGSSVGRVLSTTGVGAMAFKGYQFSNVGTIAELQSGMRSLGIAESIIARDSPKILQAMKSSGGRYGLLLTAIVGGGYAIYEATKNDASKK